MNVINNSYIMICINQLIKYYQNSNIYKIAKIISDILINSSKNSVLLGWFFTESRYSEGYKKSYTYKTFISIYNLKRDMFNCIYKTMKYSYIYKTTMFVNNIIIRIIACIGNIYKNSYIYNMYLDWIESEQI